jgi:hypothetical protein
MRQSVVGVQVTADTTDINKTDINVTYKGLT